MKEYTETEMWIAITSIMKTSETVKKLPKEVVEYLYIQLKREFAPHITDEDIENINKFINDLAKDVQKKCLSSAMKMLGKGDQKEAIKQLTNLVGKEKADIVTKLFGDRK